MLDAILLAALIAVESGGNPRAYNAHECAAGILQIRPCYVQGVNRIYHKNYRHPQDCFSPVKSIEIVTLYLQHYAPDGSHETLARIHNGGPRGHKKQATMNYWTRVKAEIARHGATPQIQ